MADKTTRPKRSCKSRVPTVLAVLGKDINKSGEKLKRGRHGTKKNTVVTTARSINTQESGMNRSDFMCSACKINAKQDTRGLQCNNCESWFHSDCLFLKDAEYSRICKSGNSWTCIGCAEVNANESKITWGELPGLSNITQIVRGCYQEMVKWKKNIFILPRGRSGTDFINELTRLIYLFIDDTSLTPTLIDAEGWKHILCSRSYGKASVQLCGAIAELAKKLSTSPVDHRFPTKFVACRLVPLDKGEDETGKIGVRPVGVGEVLRRIVGKLIMNVIKDDIQNAAGPIQTCAGLKGGIEACIHATRNIWEEESTEGVLMVDAENAFNTLNRKLALHNVRQLCPPFYQYLHNTYQEPAKLIVNDQKSTEFLSSDEGCTQGDVTAMAFYALGLQPLTRDLSSKTDTKSCRQMWYADDATAIGKLKGMKDWWDTLCAMGPGYGYYPKPSKTVLIIKNPQLKKAAQDTFQGTGIKISCDGERHLGAVLGTDNFRDKYVQDKVSKWVKDVEELTLIGEDDPQLAYSSFTKALSHRWTFFQRTIKNVSHLFKPLENVIRQKFIPAIIGRQVNDIERQIFTLPVRLGGLGISNPVLKADEQFSASMSITKELQTLIKDQEATLDKYNATLVHYNIGLHKSVIDDKLKAEATDIKEKLSEPAARSMSLAQEKGAGAWLTVLPLQNLGFVLNKEEFRDGLRLRYGWQIPGIPTYCICGMKNTIDHTLTCKHGGHLIFRHNRVRDTNAEFLREICHDVKTEPELMPIYCKDSIQGNDTENARLDISARGLYGPLQKTMFDVRIFHPNALTYRNRDVSSVYKQHEEEKRKKYEQRVIQIEKCSFTPLVYSTTGGMAPKALEFHKRLASLVAEKRNERYEDVMGTMRTKLAFSLLKSVLVSLRGHKGKRNYAPATPISCLSFNLIPGGIKEA